ncbi:MAG TPA: VOC family protein [Steroidobacteraceae bacterium]|nr:VOC family protein [Steroidobacteraceae bacterium]
MINHMSIGVRSLARAKAFYDPVLAAIGYRCLSEDAGSLGYGASSAAFWVLRTERPMPANPESGLHICFNAPNGDAVKRFHAAGLANGGQDNGKPGLRTDYGPDYFAAFLVDPEGYRLEAHSKG